MTNTSIARPYAKAAFEFAKQADELQRWSIALRTLAIAIEDAAVRTMLADPRVSSESIVDLLIEVLRDVISDGSAAFMQSVENFLNLLSEYKRLAVLPEINSRFEADVAEDAGYLQLTVTSAFELDSEQQTKIVERLKKQLGSEIKATYQLDPAIIGGIIVRSNKWVMDDSVRGRLAKLQTALQ